MWCVDAHFFPEIFGPATGDFYLDLKRSERKGCIEYIRTTRRIRLVSILLVRLVQVESWHAMKRNTMVGKSEGCLNDIGVLGPT